MLAAITPPFRMKEDLKASLTLMPATQVFPPSSERLNWTWSVKLEQLGLLQTEVSQARYTSPLDPTTGSLVLPPCLLVPISVKRENVAPPSTLFVMEIPDPPLTTV